MRSTSQPSKSSAKPAIVLASTALFCVTYVLFIYAISNHLGRHILEGYSPTGGYIPHDYYTGITTHTPFKIALGVTAFSLLVWTVKLRFSTLKTILFVPLIVVALGVIGVFMSFMLFWEF